MTELAHDRCVPCEGGVPRLAPAEVEALRSELGGGWEVVDGHHLARTFRFPTYRRALDLTMRIGELAEEQGHHPHLCLSWGRVEVTIWTHAIDGLHRNDFVLAAKIDRLLDDAGG